jgi:hypothetical protein
MPIALSCECGKRLRIKDEFAGRSVRCPACRATLDIPEPEEETARPKKARAREMTWEEIGLSEPQPGSAEAMASNPGRVRLHYRHFLRGYLIESLSLFGLLLLFILPAVLWHWGFWLGVVVLLVLNVKFWRGVRWQGLYGCVNPGVVVSTEPYVVAVLGDLTTSGEPWPVIKIQSEPRGRMVRMTGGPPEVGARLATVAIYWGSRDADHWANFFPDVINCLTTDAEVIERVQGTIDEENWQELDEGLKRIPQPYKPGLYPLAAEEEKEERKEVAEEREEEKEEHKKEEAAVRLPPPRKALKKIIAECMPHRFVSEWYLGNEIPEKKLNNAMSSYAKDVEADEVLGLADNTVFGNAKQGLVLTSKGIVFQNGGVSANIDWQDVAGAEVVSGLLFYSVSVGRCRGGDVKLDFTGFDVKFPKALTEVLRRVAELNGREG